MKYDKGDVVEILGTGLHGEIIKVMDDGGLEYRVSMFSLKNPFFVMIHVVEDKIMRLTTISMSDVRGGIPKRGHSETVCGRAVEFCQLEK